VDYGKLLRRSWEILWEHKFLFLLGVLVALGSGGSNNFSTGSSFGQLRGEGGQVPEFRGPPMGPDFWDQFAVPGGITIAVIILIVGIALVVGLAVWVISTLARGALISGVDTIHEGGSTSFGQAFGAAWRKVWTLLGIGVLPAIPALGRVLTALAGLLAYTGLARVVSTRVAVGPNLALASIVGLAMCLMVPLSVILGLLQTFANRAAMIEGLGVFDAYKRGLSVLFGNIGSAILLLLIQIAIGIVVGLVTVLPVMFMALCCIFWPVLLLLQGGIAAYMSTMWTLAWEEWTGRTEVTLAA
jgi:hypothetical protein